MEWYPPFFDLPIILGDPQKKGGVPPSPSLFSHHAWRILNGIEPWRCHRASLLALSRFYVNLCRLLKKKNSSRRRSLGCLSSYANVKGEEALGRRVQAERTHMERVALRMAERREETWRPLNRKRVAAFIRMYLLAVVYDENAYRQHHEKRKSEKILNEALVRRIIPYIYKNRVWSIDDTLWPMTLEDFKELDSHLASLLYSILSYSSRMPSCSSHRGCTVDVWSRRRLPIRANRGLLV